MRKGCYKFLLRLLLYPGNFRLLYEGLWNIWNLHPTRRMTIVAKRPEDENRNVGLSETSW